MVDMKGSTCKHCGGKFHNCSSCDPDTYTDHGYCSHKCLMESKEFNAAKANAQALYDSLDGAQKKRLSTFMEDTGYYEFMDLYEEDK